MPKLIIIRVGKAIWSVKAKGGKEYKMGTISEMENSGPNNIRVQRLKFE
jgi:hypothetical protein